METFASPIPIPVVPDRQLARAVVAAHCTVFAVLVAMFPGSVHGVMLACAVAASLWYQCRSSARAHARWRALLLGADDHWSVISPAGEIRAARLLPGVFVSAPLVILRLKPTGERPFHVVLTPANTPASAFRRLRVRLRLPLAG